MPIKRKRAVTGSKGVIITWYPDGVVKGVETHDQLLLFRVLRSLGKAEKRKRREKT